MIGKLLKYDIKATARYLIPLYIVFLAISLVNGFFNPFDVLESNNTFSLKVLASILMVIAYFIMMVGVLIGTGIILVLRFQRNLLGDEGYLSLTLPVKSWEHIISKLITSILGMVSSVLVILGSISIIMRINIKTIIDEVSILTDEMEVVFGSNIKLIFTLYLFVAMVLLILTVFNAITIGHQFQNHKIVASFLASFVFYFIYQIILIVVGIIYLINTYGNFSNIPINSDVVPNGGLLLIVISLVLIIMSIGHYLSINYLFNNRLNLE